MHLRSETRVGVHLRFLIEFMRESRCDTAAIQTRTLDAGWRNAAPPWFNANRVGRCEAGEPSLVLQIAAWRVPAGAGLLIDRLQALGLLRELLRA